MESVEWDGRVWTRGEEGGYFQSDVYYQWNGLWLHREVWKKHNGPIPEGHEIHHSDHDPTNFDIGNLECLTKAEHGARHKWNEDRRVIGLPHLDRIRPLTKEWHASDEGRAANSRAAALAYQKFTPRPKSCEQCSVEFEPKKIGNLDRFCSNKCRAAHRRQSGIDDIERFCACGKAFTVNRYSTSQSCSRSCAMKLRARNMRG